MNIKVVLIKNSCVSSLRPFIEDWICGSVRIRKPIPTTVCLLVYKCNQNSDSELLFGDEVSVCVYRTLEQLSVGNGVSMDKYQGKETWNSNHICSRICLYFVRKKSVKVTWCRTTRISNEWWKSGKMWTKP